MTQPLNEHLPTQYTGANMAPIAPILKLREPNGHKSPYSQHYIADAIKEKYQSLIKSTDPEFREMIGVGQMIALYIEGKQFLDWNPYTHSYTPRKVGRTDPNKIKAINLMQSFCTEWQDKWGSANSDIILNPLSNRDQDISKARKANMVVNHLERKMYDSWYKYHEGMMAQVFGWYGNRVRPCNKKGRLITQPIMEDREVQIGQGWGKCYDCEYAGAKFNAVETGENQSMPMCPECGSTAVYHEPPVTQLMPQQVGEEQIRIPDIIAEQLPFPACRWNPRFRAEDSSWFIYEQEVDLNVIRRVLGDVRIPEGGTGNDIGMEVMRTLARTGAPVSGRSDAIDSSMKEGGLVTELYLSADDLYDIEIKGDEATIDGGKLPRGRGSEAWPNGACFVGVNGFALLSGIHPDEHHSESVTSGVYHMKPLSGTGRGVADVLEAQKRFTRFDFQTTVAMDSTATPATLHAAGAINPSDRRKLSQSDVDIPVNIQNFPEFKSLRDLVAPMERQSVPGDMLQYTYTHLMSFMQRLYHTTSQGGVNPEGVRNDTATYAEIADQNSNSLFTPSLTLKADTYLKTGKKAFELWRKLNPQPAFISFKTPSRSGARGMDISAADVDGEFEWTVVEGSELPKNKLSKRRDMIAFYGMFGGILPYIQAKATSPQEVAETERVFDMDFSTDDYDEIGETCRIRFEMAKGLLGQSEGMRSQAAAQFGVEVPPVDPMMLLPEVRPTMLITESKLAEKALWFSNLLDTTEGMEMSDEERSLVSAFIQGFKMLAEGQALEIARAETQVAVGANAPMADDQANREMQKESAMNEQGAATEQANAQSQQGEAEAQREHELTTKVLDLANSEAERQTKLDIAKQSAKKTAKK